MNARIEYTLSSEFGPPSEHVNISGLTKEAAKLPSPEIDTSDSNIDWEAIANECSVDDICASLLEIWNNPVLSAYLSRNHENTVAGYHGSKSSKLAKSRKKTASTAEPYHNLDEIKRIKEKMEKIPLSTWPLLPNSALFTRPPRSSDYNVLTQVRTSDADTAPEAGGPQALITFTVHNKVVWRPSIVTQNSRHVILSSQTLGDLFEVIPCISNEIPEEVIADSRFVGYEQVNEMKGSSGCVVCINGLAYGDGLSEEDYADKLLKHLKLTKSSTELRKAQSAMHDTPLSSLSLQINEPYWLLHQGNCEHFIIINQIRIRDSTDPVSGYPLTVSKSPATLDLCRACARTPAVLSVSGDVRLEESPCLLCEPCWQSMGPPANGIQVTVVPLPKYGLAW